MRQIGIFGGTFDPVHIGHLHSAWEVHQQLSLDRLYFVPNAQTVHKSQPNTSFSHRLAMLSLAIEGVEGWYTSTCEGERSGGSYTYHTLEYFRDQLSNQLDSEVTLWLILGSDAYYQFHQWYRWQEIVQLANLAVMRRAGGLIQGGCEQTQEWLQASPQKLTNGRVVPVAVSGLEISSSYLRTSYQQGKPARFLLPDSVRQYIDQMGIYQSTAD